MIHTIFLVNIKQNNDQNEDTVKPVLDEAWLLLSCFPYNFLLSTLVALSYHTVKL